MGSGIAPMLPLGRQQFGGDFSQNLSQGHLLVTPSPAAVLRRTPLVVVRPPTRGLVIAVVGWGR